MDSGVGWTDLGAVLLWIAVGGGGPFLAGKVWAFLLASWAWFQHWPHLAKWIAPMLLSIVFAIGSHYALTAGAGAIEGIQPWWAMVVSAIVGYLGTQRGYIEVRSARYGAAYRAN